MWVFSVVRLQCSKACSERRMGVSGGARALTRVSVALLCLLHTHRVPQGQNASLARVWDTVGVSPCRAHDAVWGSDAGRAQPRRYRTRPGAQEQRRVMTRRTHGGVTVRLHRQLWPVGPSDTSAGRLVDVVFHTGSVKTGTLVRF